MTSDRWVGVGAGLASVLRSSYETAILRGGSPADTIDLLAHAVVPAPPAYVPERLMAGLREAAPGRHAATLRRSRGEFDRTVAVGRHDAAPPGGSGEFDRTVARSRRGAARRRGGGELDRTVGVGRTVGAPRRGRGRRELDRAVADAEVDATLREAEWQVRRVAGLPAVPVRESQVEPWSRRPLWTPAARAVVAGTLAEARDRGVAFAGRSHLLLAMLRLPDCAGARYLAPDAASRAAMIAAVAGDPRVDRTAKPYPEPEEIGLTDGRGLLARLGRAMARFVRFDPPLAAATHDIKAQAVRLDHGVAGAVHALLAMLRMDAAIAATGMRLPPPMIAPNQGAALLRAAGVDPHALAAALADAAAPPHPSPELVAEQVKNLRRGDPFLADELDQARKRAGELSLRHQHESTGTTHYLLALLEARSVGPALERCGVDAADLSARTEAQLGAVPRAWQ
ncbi:Clp amino terminal domain-containing protein, pathogenicity island component [Asanoa hainanensis]|uniref:Clp amino terminal domain-containing protein, pathogenicity island component n=1 Tax=Asanoa hainanensis TaxID=560556 RepID=A0A239NFV8_9ACTN|nr:Clp protease N-terminal domain-containing protein [Asanoa hainanensis]SNT53294.1 Clp amino terminal domain-containing protein, pathogenicity island component [Asanoa hainanensis]